MYIQNTSSSPSTKKYIKASQFVLMPWSVQDFACIGILWSRPSALDLTASLYFLCSEGPTSSSLSPYFAASRKCDTSLFHVHEGAFTYIDSSTTARLRGDVSLPMKGRTRSIERSIDCAVAVCILQNHDQHVEVVGRKHSFCSLQLSIGMNVSGDLCQIFSSFFILPQKVAHVASARRQILHVDYGVELKECFCERVLALLHSYPERSTLNIAFVANF